MTDLPTALRAAVGRGEIAAWFQPQLDLQSGRLIAAEALCRWTHPVLGSVPPSTFIPLAEQIGVIDEIGQFMLDEGLAAATAWSQLDDPIEVSVNVSPAQLFTADFTNGLAATLRRMSLPPHSLTVEITEALGIKDVPVVVQRLDELRSLGLGVSLDDFGVGHSSLRQVRRLHATELKIDRSLITDDSPETTELLIAVIGEVHDAGLRVVGEGVETAAQLERVRALECDRAQGYLIARPMPRAELEQLLSKAA